MNLGRAIIVEAAQRRFRHEIHVLVDSSILFPLLNDELVDEYEQNSRDKFYLYANSFMGPNWDISIEWWPKYDIPNITKRIIRMWKLISSVLRCQSINGLPKNKITKIFGLVSVKRT